MVGILPLRYHHWTVHQYSMNRLVGWLIHSINASAMAESTTNLKISEDNWMLG